ncbi:MAG: FadR/GntR family transcriptional regulator [Nocardioidaceae bacterium]
MTGVAGISRFLDGILDEAAPTPTLSPITLPTTPTEVADRLMTAIAVGEYLPGDRLPAERDMASSLGVSRATVREAIEMLDAVVEVRRGRLGGWFVRSSWGVASAEAVRRTLLPRWPEMQQLLDLRGLMEELVGRTAAERRSKADIKRMRAALDVFAEATTAHGEQFADAAFHRSILDATGNPGLVRLSQSLLAGTSLAFPVEPWHTGEGQDRPEFRKTLSEHEGIFAAVKRGDVDQAGRLARGHFAVTIQTFTAVVERAKAPDSETS